jgi:hypothetical protein
VGFFIALSVFTVDYFLLNPPSSAATVRFWRVAEGFAVTAAPVVALILFS